MCDSFLCVTNFYSAIQCFSYVYMYSPFAFYLSDKVEYVCTVSDCLTCPGVNAARDALLTFMVGGEAKAFERAKEYLSCMGKNVVHCGPAGNGQVSN